MGSRTRYATVLVVAGLLIATGCGGSSRDEVGPGPLNEFEKELVGTYDLSDFEIYEVGVCTHRPEDFEAWGGQMTLADDRYATIAMELCEHAGSPSATCDRYFTWEADAGLVYLTPLDSGERSALLEWVGTGMGQVRTATFLPSNLEGYGPLLVDDGRETLDWRRTD